MYILLTFFIPPHLIYILHTVIIFLYLLVTILKQHVLINYNYFENNYIHFTNDKFFASNVVNFNYILHLCELLKFNILMVQFIFWIDTFQLINTYVTLADNIWVFFLIELFTDVYLYVCSIKTNALDVFWFMYLMIVMMCNM